MGIKYRKPSLGEYLLVKVLGLAKSFLTVPQDLELDMWFKI